MITYLYQNSCALDTKIKFEYARQFAGLNEALEVTVVKPEIDKFDTRRKKQAVEREANYQANVKASDSRMIAVGRQQLIQQMDTNLHTIGQS